MNVFDEEAQINNIYANSFLYKYYYDGAGNDKDLSVKYITRNCELDHEESISKLCKNHGVIAFKNEIIRQNILNRNHIMDFNIKYVKSCILKDEKYTSSYNPELAFKYFKSLEEKFGSSKKVVYFHLAECYEKGIGVNANLRKALEYYKLYNGITIIHKVNELEKKLNEIIKEREDSEKATIARSLMEKYYHNKYYDYDQKYGEEVRRLNLTKDSDALEEELILRNQLLDWGYSPYEIYDLDGNFRGFEIMALSNKELQQKLEKNRLAREKEKAEKLEREKQLAQAKKQEQAKVKKTTTTKETPKTVVIPKEDKTVVKEPKKSETSPKNITSSSNVTSTKTTTNVAKQTLAPVSDDDPYFKELLYFAESATGESQLRRIARLRRKLDYPLEPKMLPRCDENGVKRSKREIEKIYMKELEERKLKLIEYKERLYSQENILQKDYEVYRRKVWHITSNAQILNGKQFAQKCEDAYNSKIPSYEEYKKITIKLSNY